MNSTSISSWPDKEKEVINKELRERLREGKIRYDSTLFGKGVGESKNGMIHGK